MSEREALNQINSQLECLDEEKSALEEKIAHALKDIMDFNQQIEQAEREIQEALLDKMAKDCQARVKCEINRLKQAQKRAHKILASTLEKIRKVSCDLEILDERKCRAVESVYCCMKEITEVNKQIEAAEKELQRTLNKSTVNECKERIMCEIERIKREKKKAQVVFGMYDKQLQKACKHYKKCSEGKIC